MCLVEWETHGPRLNRFLLAVFFFSRSAARSGVWKSWLVNTSPSASSHSKNFEIDGINVVALLVGDAVVVSAHNEIEGYVDLVETA